MDKCTKSEAFLCKAVSELLRWSISCNSNRSFLLNRDDVCATTFSDKADLSCFCQASKQPIDLNATKTREAPDLSVAQPTSLAQQSQNP